MCKEVQNKHQKEKKSEERKGKGIFGSGLCPALDLCNRMRVQNLFPIKTKAEKTNT